jgi:hypothetical protein
MNTIGSLEPASYVLISYAAYIAISVLLTVWVGHTLHSNGRVFLVSNFEGQEAIADSINHLLLVGFYLINLGFVSLALRFGARPENWVQVSTKIGIVIVLLGVMHFFNMFWLVRFRKSSLLARLAGNPAGMPATETA